ncbi:hypothetical protein Tco_0597288 [Tanacetum coccineum]
MEEVSLTIDEAKLKKMADEMLRQRCTSGDEHQYHIDQMKNFLKSDIVWENRKEKLLSLHIHERPHHIQSCQRDPKAPALSLDKSRSFVSEERKFRAREDSLKSYNNDVKYGYVQRELTNDEVEYLKFFEEEIEVRLNYRNQMRRWEMYVNGRTTVTHGNEGKAQINDP